MKIEKITGLIAAPFTPMKEDGTVHPEIIPAYAAKLKSDGVKGVFICGTTGEGMLMTNEERKIVAGGWVKEQTHDFRIIIHVGTTSSRQSRELAAHAQGAGAYAIGCMGPVVLKPTGIDQLVNFCAEVASGAPDLPFYYYHIPAVSGVDLPMSIFIEKASQFVNNFTGIKFTDNNFIEFQKCLHMDNGKWDILHGYDEVLLAGLAFGASGAVGSTYNFMAPLYQDIIDAFHDGDLESARKKQMISVNIITILIKYGGAIVSGKALMKYYGIDCGNFRPPVALFDDSLYDEMIRDLRKAGFFEIKNKK